MKYFKVDVLWENSKGILDPDAIQDYIQADCIEEAEELAKDYLEDNGINVAKEVVGLVTREIE